jgi:hypothetical protein
LFLVQLNFISNFPLPEIRQNFVIISPLNSQYFITGLSVVAHACDPSYSGTRGRRTVVPEQPRQNVNKTPPQQISWEG